MGFRIWYGRIHFMWSPQQWGPRACNYSGSNGNSRVKIVYWSEDTELLDSQARTQDGKIMTSDKYGEAYCLICKIISAGAQSFSQKPEYDADMKWIVKCQGCVVIIPHHVSFVHITYTPCFFISLLEVLCQPCFLLLPMFFIFPFHLFLYFSFSCSGSKFDKEN